jgi:NodT family efflux transporter outer membrane factor (OMF) lipoprotein
MARRQIDLHRDGHRSMKNSANFLAATEYRLRMLRPFVSAAFAAVLLAGCTVGPKYVRPTAEVPADFKDAAEWKTAQPSDEIAKGKWWEIYQDPQLNSLEEQVAVSNQNLKAAEAQFAQARAALQVTRSGQFPTITGGLSGTRLHVSSNRATGGSTTNYSDYDLPVDASYEPDVWGRVRREVEASRSAVQASAADLANVNLSLQAELASDYFNLRGLDAQKQLLDSTVVSYERALQLTQSRYNGGVATAVDVAQAQTQLDQTRALSIGVGVDRAAFEDAIAVLVGKPSPTFSVQPLPLTATPPSVPPGLPSDLLERRPDIAASERRVQQANAQIGVAKSAYFPAITLTAAGGFESAALGTLLQGPSGLWNLGGAALETLFDGGVRRGVSQEALAARDQSIANYRQTVLTAFQEVEDNLAALRILQQQAQVQSEAVASAEHSLALSNTRYVGGVTSYLEVTTAESAALSDEITAVNLLTRRMAASVLLVKAIGGGWNVSQLPPS